MPSAYYRTDDPVENFKIRIGIREVIYDFEVCKIRLTLTTRFLSQNLSLEMMEEKDHLFMTQSSPGNRKCIVQG
jgi:hypothetical protein